MRTRIIILAILFFFSLSFAQFNNAAHFYGNSGYINVPTDSTLQIGEKITLETWVKIDTFHNSQIGLAGSWDDISSSQRTWFLWILSGRFEFLVSSNGSSFGRAAGFLPETNTWYHIAGTFDGSAIKLYVNDSLIASVNYTATIHKNELPFYMGRTESGSNGSDYLYGWLDELRVWNKARSQDQLMQTSKDTLNSKYYNTADSGLVAYYRFDDVQNLSVGVDSTLDVFDHSVQANHGDIVGEVDIDSSGIVITHFENKKDFSIANEFMLFQNYPNPFNPQTNINYQLAINSEVKLTIYDVTGREIRTLVNNYQPAGSYNIIFNASDLTSGIYIYKLTTQNYSQSKKMILIK